MRSWVVLLFLPAVAIVACENKERAPSDAGSDVSATSAELETDAEVDAGKGNVGKLAAANLVTSIIDRPVWPETGTGAKRLGYLRTGAVVLAYDKPIKNEECTAGWYELVEGGFVCGKAATFDTSDPRVRLAPKQPDRDAGMPYKYGVSITEGTPVYRRVLNTEDRKKYEPWLVPVKAPEKEETIDETTGTTTVAASEEGSTSSDSPSSPSSPSPSSSSSSSPADAGIQDAGADAGKPKLKDYKGRGVLVRKMARGFFLALDREFKAAGTKWWRTTFGFAVPHDRIMVQPGVTKHVGAWWLEAALAEDDDGGAVKPGQVAFTTTNAAKITFGDNDKMAVAGTLTKRESILFTGREKTVNGVTYAETSEGFYLRLTDVKLAKPMPPSDLAPGEKWIDVDLTRQALVAFEGEKPVFATLISSGRRNLDDKERDFPTPTGTFRIREKHVTNTMDGDVASDGPYSIDDVPWVMYFHGGYALHGAFWHDRFGAERSHGCVNLAPEDARTLFNWADPPLPEAWHGVFSQDDSSGTRVVVHEDPRPKKR